MIVISQTAMGSRVTFHFMENKTKNKNEELFLSLADSNEVFRSLADSEEVFLSLADSKEVFL